VFILVLAACAAPAPRVKKVLVIGIDGVRVDILAEAATPVMDSLIAAGTFTSSARNVLPTVSGPNWSSMMTGAIPDRHGVHSNNFSNNAYDEFPDFLTRLERIDRAFETIAIVDWPPLGSTAAGGPLFGDSVDSRILVNGDELDYEVADSFVTHEAIRALETQDPHAMMVYLGNVDVVGHEHGSLSPEYRASIETADAQVGAILVALRARPTYIGEDWLLLMSTDHGRRDDGGHGGESELERTIFYLASGPSATAIEPDAAATLLDVATTALVHLGVAIDPSWQLDGKVVGLRQR
jgi:predicted AlkP superfamily pyrophosphatase or phosphodiesterase